MFLEKVCLAFFFQPVCFIWPGNGFRKNDPMFTCIGKFPLPEEITFQGKFSFCWRHVTKPIPEVDFPLFKLPCNLIVSLEMI